MRSVINISLPENTVKFVKSEVTAGNFMSVSEFFRKLIREYEENKLLKELKESQREAKLEEYKYNNIKSLKDLRDSK